MQEQIRNREATPEKRGPGRPRLNPTPAPLAEPTRTDENDKLPINIGLRPMACCGRWEVPRVERWVNGSAAIICPGCGRRAMFTPAMIRLK